MAEDTTTEAFEPGCGIVEMGPTGGSEAQAGVSLVAKGRCWRCNQEGHSGRTKAQIRKKSSTAFNSICTKCNMVRHYTSMCKRLEKRTKDPTSLSQQIVDGSSQNNRIAKDGMRNMHNYGGATHLRVTLTDA